MTSQHFIKTEAVILKRTNYGDGDRIITFFSPSLGKFASVAKGSRKLASRKRSFLEPGNHLSIQLRTSKGLPYLDQLVLLNEFSSTKKELPQMKQLFQVLEILDRLTVEGEEYSKVFQQLLQVLEKINSHLSTKEIKSDLWSMLNELGYAEEGEISGSITKLISEITDRPLKSFTFLTVYNIK